MSLKVGTADAAKVYVGSTPAKKVYQGNTLVWAPFSPEQLTGLIAWYDGSDAVITTQWTDKSGAGNHGTIVFGTTGQPMAVVPNVLNGKSVVRFIVSEARVRRLSFPVNTTYTAIQVTRTRSTIGRGLGAIYPGSESSNCLMGTHSAGYDAFYDDGWINQAGWPSVPTPWKMYCAASLAGDQTYWYVNGILMGNRAPSHGFGHTLAISGYDPDNAAETCDLDMAEVLIWDRRLSDTERTRVESYLSAKWGLTGIGVTQQNEPPLLDTGPIVMP